VRSLTVCANIFALLSMTAGVRAQGFNPDEIVTNTVTGEHDCTREDFQFAYSNEAYQALKLHGMEQLPKGKCRAISLFWLPEAKIVQMTGWQQTDVFVSVTLVRTNAASKIKWIIATGGLSVPLNPEDKPDNKVTFNELLAASSARTNLEMMDLAALYMWMVGHGPDETPHKFSDALKVNDVEGWVQGERPKVVVILHQRMSLFGRPPEGEWRLEFRSDTKELRLVSVSKEGA